MIREVTTSNKNSEIRTGKKSSDDLINMGRRIALPKEVGDIILAKINELLQELNETNPQNIDLSKGGDIEKEYAIKVSISGANTYEMLCQAGILTIEK